MSYDHQVDQIRCDAGAALATTAVAIIARFIHVGLQPVWVKGAAFVIEVVPGTTAPVITIRHRPTIASATGQTTIETITVPTTRAVGDVVYVDNIDKKVLPGEEVVFDVTTASVTTGSGHCILMTAPSWDAPGNNGNMFASA